MGEKFLIGVHVFGTTPDGGIEVVGEQFLHTDGDGKDRIDKAIRAAFAEESKPPRIYTFSEAISTPGVFRRDNARLTPDIWTVESAERDVVISFYIDVNYRVRVMTPGISVVLRSLRFHRIADTLDAQRLP